MGRNGIIFLIMYCFIKLLNGQIWAGTCGRTATEKLESVFSRHPDLTAASPTGIHSLSSLVRPYISEAPSHFHQILDENTWLISVTAVFHPATPSVIGHAALIRVHPNVEESDMAITTADMCRETPINDYPFGYQARFGAYDSKHGYYEHAGIEHCWYHPDSQPGRNNIGILKLNRNIPFSNRIEPICLPGRNERITFSPGVHGRVVGVPNSVATIHQFNLKIIQQTKCELRTEAVFCVESTTANEREKNSRMNGAPFVSTVNNRSTLLGMVRRTGRFTPAEPTSISRLSPFLERQGWLEQTIREHSIVWEENPRN